MKKTLLILIIFSFDFMIFSQAPHGFRVSGRYLYDYNNEKVILIVSKILRSDPEALQVKMIPDYIRYT